MERVLFYLGPIAIYKFGVAIAIGALIAFGIVAKEADHKKLDAGQMIELALVILFSGIVGARLFYVLFYNPAYFMAHLSEVIKINEGGLSIHGGIIGGFLAGVWYCRRLKINIWKAADVIVLGAILAQGIARVGCDVFGIQMASPWFWGVTVNGHLLHPVQIYETILDLILFVFLWGKRERQDYHGQLFVYYIGGYAIVRFIVELFRTNPQVIGPLTPAHITSIIFVILAVLLGSMLSRKRIHRRLRVLPDFWVSGTVWLAVLATGVVSVILYYTLSK